MRPAATGRAKAAFIAVAGPTVKNRIFVEWIQALGAIVPVAYAADDTASKKLQNGSFEEGQTWKSNYSQPDQSEVPAWNTTAFQGKVELFRENSGI